MMWYVLSGGCEAKDLHQVLIKYQIIELLLLALIPVQDQVDMITHVKEDNSKIPPSYHLRLVHCPIPRLRFQFMVQEWMKYFINSEINIQAKGFLGYEGTMVNN